MYMNSDFIQYFQQLHGYLQAQCEKIEQMNNMIKQMQKDLNELKDKNTPPPVIRNEYKFDLLKVERLEGTLNIGLNPNGAEGSVGEFEVNQSMDLPSSNKRDPELFQRLQEKVNDYLSCEAPQMLESLEDKYACPLNEAYRQFILDDVTKQIDKRIQHYAWRINTDQLEPEQLASTEEAIVQKVKRDIDHSLEAFIKNLPKGQS